MYIIQKYYAVNDTNRMPAMCVDIICIYILWQYSHNTIKKFYFFILSKCILLLFFRSLLISYFFARFSHFKCMHVVWSCVFIPTLRRPSPTRTCCSSQLFVLFLCTISLPALSFLRYFNFQQHTSRYIHLYFFFIYNKIIILLIY